MKKIVIVLVLVVTGFSQAQSNSELVKHFEAYYKQMKVQGDVQGLMNGLTHLNILKPNQATADTLAYLYMSNNKHAQALNTIGIERKASDSDIALEVKAVCLKALNEVDKAIPHFEELFKRSPNVLIAYELADSSIQVNKLDEALQHIEYGIANSKDDIGISFYETQYPYQVKSKAAFTCLKALAKYREDQVANLDVAMALLDEALVIEPNFNMAKVSKEALMAQKQKVVKKD